MNLLRLIPRLSLAVGALTTAAVVMLAATAGGASGATAGRTNSSDGFSSGGAVTYVVALPSGVHIGPIAVDKKRSGLWYATADGVTDALHFLTFGTLMSTTYAVPGSERTAFLREGIAVAGDGSVWAGIGHSLARWDPATRAVALVSLPPPPAGTVLATPLAGQPIQPTLTAILADNSGSIWVGQQGIRAVLRFEASGSAGRYLELPDDSGDVWSGTVSPAGDLLWTTGFSASSNGKLEAMVIRLNPTSGSIAVIRQPSHSIAADGSHGFYVTVGEQLMHDDGSGKRTPVASALTDAAAFDAVNGRLWFQSRDEPAFDAVDIASGKTRQFGYPGSSTTVALPGMSARTELVRPHIRNMVVDTAGNLWFSIRGGSQIGRVSVSTG